MRLVISLLIVADRNRLKAYEIDESPDRGALPRLLGDISLDVERGRYQDKLTDQADRSRALSRSV